MLLEAHLSSVGDLNLDDWLNLMVSGLVTLL